MDYITFNETWMASDEISELDDEGSVSSISSFDQTEIRLDVEEGPRQQIANFGT